MTGRLLVRSSPAGRLDGEEPCLVDRSDDAGVFVEPFGPGRFVIHGADGRDTWADVADARVDRDGIGSVEVVVEGWRFELEVEDAARAALRERATRDDAAGVSSGPHEIRAIIPGRVAGVRVAVGDRVTSGQTLLVVEAMKMQNELRAPRDGTVTAVTVGETATIELGDLLVVLE